MKESDKEKYLGDFITKHSNYKETIKERNQRGNAIISEIKVILQDIPIGKKNSNWSNPKTSMVLKRVFF